MSSLSQIIEGDFLLLGGERSLLLFLVFCFENGESLIHYILELVESEPVDGR